nr:tenascin-R-like [Lytechinus pictus]
MAVPTVRFFRIFWIIAVLTCCSFTYTNGQGIDSTQVDKTTSYGFDISWTVSGSWDYYTVTVLDSDGEIAPGYPIDVSSTSAELIHLFNSTSYDIHVQPKSNSGDMNGVNGTATGLTHARILTPSLSTNLIQLAFPIDASATFVLRQVEDPSVNSTFQGVSVDGIVSAFFLAPEMFPYPAPGDLIYASVALSADPTNPLNEIHFRRPPNPPRNVTFSPIGDTVHVNFLPPETGSYDGFKIRANGVSTDLPASSTTWVSGSLTTNTPYTFEVTSFVGIGGDETESISESGTISLVEITLDRRGETDLGLSWGEPVGNDYDSLVLTWAPPESSDDLSMDTRAYNLTMLQPGTDYTVSLYKKSGGVRGDLVAQTTFQTFPATVNGTTITYDLTVDGDLVLNWQSPVGLVDSYNVTVTPGDLTVNVPAGGDPSYTFTSLNPSTEHTFSIVTIKGEFVSPDAASFSALTGPAAPTGIMITSYSTGADISWASVPDADMYRVIVTDSSEVSLFDERQSGTTVEQRSLQESTDYAVTITPFDTDGVVGRELIGRTSNMEFTTIARIGTVASRTSNSITLGELSEGFGVETDVDTVSANAMGVAVMASLDPGMCYTFSIKNNSVLLDIFEECTLPDAPTLSVVKFLPFRFCPGVGHHRTNRWNLLLVSGGTLIINGKSVCPFKMFSRFTFSDLKPFTTYTFTVVTVFMGLNSSEAQESLSTALSSPSDFVVSSFDFTEITLEWTSVPNATMYRLTRTPGSRTVETSEDTYTFTDLSPGTSYTFTIVSFRSGDFDSEEVTLTNSTAEIPVGEILVSDVTSDRAFLQWRSYPTSPFYSLFFSPVDAVGSLGGTSDLFVEIDILTPGVVVDVTLQNPISSQDLATTQLRSAPESPANLTLNSIDVLTANIMWDSPPGPHDGYQIFIQYLEPADSERTLVDTISTNPGSYIITGLRPRTGLTIEVGTYLDASGTFPFQSSDESKNPKLTNETDGPTVFELVLVSSGTDFIQAAWGVSPDYTTTYSIDPDGGAELDLDREENGLLTYRGLQPATEYTICVMYNDSMNTQVNVSTFTEPLQPADFVVISATYQEIDLSWSPGGGMTSMYEITLTTEACEGYSISNETTNPNATLEDLRIATSFVITVVAVVDGGTKSAPGSITVATDDTDVVENAVSVLSASTLNERDAQLTVALLSDSDFTATVDSTSYSGSCRQSSIEEVRVNTGAEIPLNITRGTTTSLTFYRTDPGILQDVGVESITSTSAVVGFLAPLRGSYDGAILILTSLQDEDYYPPGQEWNVSSPDTNYTLEDLKPSTSYNVSANAFLLSTSQFDEQFSREEIETFNTL